MTSFQSLRSIFDRGTRAALRLAPVALFALSGCAAPGPSVDRAVRGAWRIEQARAEPMLDKRLARLDFGADGRLTGHTSCNRLSAAYTLEGDKVDIGRVVTTRMACPRLQMEQEDRVLTALELARTARVRPDGLLELRDEDGRGVLRATRWRDE
jgi:heat shock protein HslJ